MVDMRHMDHLAAVAARDVAHLQEKEATYQGSWKRRGGVGAFMMLARKWDRLDTILGKQPWNYDVFEAIENLPSGDDGTVLAEVRDLRRYLLLVEAEMVARGAVVHGLPKVAPLPLATSQAGTTTKADTTRLPQGAVAVADASGLPNHGHRPPQPEYGKGPGEHHGRRPPPAGVEDTSLHGRAEQAPEPPAEAPVVYWVDRSEQDGRTGGPPAGTKAPWRTVVKGDPALPESPRWGILDRLLITDDASIAHLAQLRRGLNSVEYNEMVAQQPWFAHFYWFDDKGRNEWTLHGQYERWAVTGHR